jgi:hypothetical protein
MLSFFCFWSIMTVFHYELFEKVLTDWLPEPLFGTISSVYSTPLLSTSLFLLPSHPFYPHPTPLVLLLLDDHDCLSLRTVREGRQPLVLIVADCCCLNTVPLHTLTIHSFFPLIHRPPSPISPLFSPHHTTTHSYTPLLTCHHLPPPLPFTPTSSHLTRHSSPHPTPPTGPHPPTPPRRLRRLRSRRRRPFQLRLLCHRAFLAQRETVRGVGQ